MAGGAVFLARDGLVRDFARYAGRRILIGLLLALAGSAAEAIGLIWLAALLRVILMPGAAAVFPAPLHWSAALGGTPDGRLVFALSSFTVLMLARAAMLSVRDDYLARLQYGYVESAKAKLLTRIANARYRAISRIPQGHLNQAVNGEINDLALAANSLILSGVAAISFMATGALACLLSPRLAATALLASTVLIAALPLARKATRSGFLLRQRRRAVAEQMLRFLAGLKSAKAQGLDRALVEELQTASSEVVDTQIAFLRLQSTTRNLWAVLAMLVAITCTASGLLLWRIEPAVLIAFLLLSSRISGSAISLHQGLHQILECGGLIEHLRDIHARLEERPPGQTIPPPAITARSAGFSLRGVHYLHRDGGGLSEVTVDIPAGAFWGVSGVSGAGKTTFVDLLAGVLEPQRGTIFRAGVPLVGDVLKRHRRELAYVGQDAVLFGETLRHGFRLADPGAADARITEVLALVGAEEFVSHVPGALDLPLIGREAFMSSGERQRLAIASALLRRPSLLILDEATNALDPASEKRILARLIALDPRPTILLIAHRPPALATCEHVLRFENGRLLQVAAAPFEHLVKDYASDARAI